jgi:hypothetical protein
MRLDGPNGATQVNLKDRPDPDNVTVLEANITV